MIWGDKNLNCDETDPKYMFSFENQILRDYKTCSICESQTQEQRDLCDVCKNTTPQEWGLKLSNSENICEEHNKITARSKIRYAKSIKPLSKYHYIVYMPINGRLFELDGLKKEPIDHGVTGSIEHWVDDAQPFIDSRMQSYERQKIETTLLALIPDQQRKYLELSDSVAAQDEVIEDVNTVLSHYFQLLGFREEDARNANEVMQ